MSLVSCYFVSFQKFNNTKSFLSSSFYITFFLTFSTTKQSFSHYQTVLNATCFLSVLLISFILLPPQRAINKKMDARKRERERYDVSIDMERLADSLSGELESLQSKLI